MDLQAAIDELDAQIALGALRVTFEGKTVEYRSLSEMRQTRALLAGRLAGGPPTSRTSLATFRKG